MIKQIAFDNHGCLHYTDGRAIYYVNVDREASEIYREPTQARTKKEAGEYTADFMAFWNIYPRKEGKLEAFASYRKVSPMDYGKIFQAVQAQVKHGCLKKDLIHPHPKTWLNHRRWEDVLEKTRTQKKAASDVCDNCGKPSVGSVDGGGKYCSDPVCKKEVRGY